MFLLFSQLSDGNSTIVEVQIKFALQKIPLNLYKKKKQTAIVLHIMKAKRINIDSLS